MIGLADYLLEKSARSAMFGPKGVKALKNMMNADDKVAMKMQPWAQNFRLSARDSFIPEKSPLNRGVHGAGNASDAQVQGQLSGFVKKLHPDGKAQNVKEVFSPVGLNKDVSQSHTQGLEGARPSQRTTIISKAEAGSQTALNIQNNRYNSAAQANTVSQSNEHNNRHISFKDDFKHSGFKADAQKWGFQKELVQKSDFVPAQKGTVSMYSRGYRAK